MNKTTMKLTKTILFAAFCFILPFVSHAQSYEVGFLGGGINYQGDLADGVIVLKETQPAYGLVLRYSPLNFVSVRLGYVQGRIVGDDVNSSNVDIRKRGFKIASNIRELSVLTEWHLPSYGKSTMGIFKPSVTPFLFAGVGFASGDGKPQAPADRYPDPFPEFNATSNFISIPFGGGIKFHFAENFATSVEWGIRATFSDYVDGVSTNANPLKNDYYMLGGITFTYVIDGGGDNPFRRGKRR